MNKFAKFAAPAGLLGLISSANAEVPAGVIAAITEAGEDGLTIVGLMAAGGAAVFLLSKVLKRFGVSL